METLGIEPNNSGMPAMCWARPCRSDNYREVLQSVLRLKSFISPLAGDVED